MFKPDELSSPVDPELSLTHSLTHSRKLVLDNCTGVEEKQQTRRFFSDSFWFIEKLKKFVLVDSFSSVEQNQHQDMGGSSWRGSDMYRTHPHSQLNQSQVRSDRVQFSKRFIFCFDLRQCQTHQNHQEGRSAPHGTISRSLALSLAAVPAVTERFGLTGTTCSWRRFGSKEGQHCVDPVRILFKPVQAGSASLQPDLPEGSATPRVPAPMVLDD